MLLAPMAVSGMCLGRHFSHANGMGGRPFSFSIDGLCRVRVVEVCHGDHIDSIRFGLENGDWSERIGGDGGQKSQFVCNENEYITQVKVWADRGTNAIQFFTPTRASPRYGDCGSNSILRVYESPSRELVAQSDPDGRTKGLPPVNSSRMTLQGNDSKTEIVPLKGCVYQLVGMKGRAGDMVDKVEFEFAEVSMFCRQKYQIWKAMTEAYESALEEKDLFMLPASGNSRTLPTEPKIVSSVIQFQDNDGAIKAAKVELRINLDESIVDIDQDESTTKNKS